MLLLRVVFFMFSRTKNNLLKISVSANDCTGKFEKDFVIEKEKKNQTIKLFQLHKTKICWSAMFFQVKLETRSY